MWMSAIQPREPQCKNERAHSVRTLKSMMKTYSLHDERAIERANRLENADTAVHSSVVAG